MSHSQNTFPTIKASFRYVSINQAINLGKNSFEDVRNHIKDRFVSAEDKESEERRHIYLHYTNATDKNNIDIVFGAACDIILQNNLTRAGMS